jgi:hypothetical protein
MISSIINKQQKNQVIFLALLLVIITINCGRTTSASEGLIGIWRTSDMRYNDTSFEIKKNEIIFRDKEGNRESFSIIKIKKEPMQDKEWIQYTIFYWNRDLQKVEFPFYFQPDDLGMIRFKNQPYLVWKKDTGITT